MQHTYTHKVQYYETDKMGITHHSNYIRWMEEARVEFLAHTGWSYARMEAEGIISPVLHADCDYKKTTTFADEVEISISGESYNGVRLRLAYQMTCKSSGELAAVGHTEHCFLGADGMPIRMKKQFPELDEMLRQITTYHD